MASNLTIQQGQSSVFCGSPTIVSVQSAATPSGATFHRVLLDVVVTSSVTGKYGGTYQLSHPITDPNGQTVTFDISSCLRSASEAFQYSPLHAVRDGVFVSFPVFTATISARDTWVINAEEEQHHATAPISHTAIMGHYSDFERLLPTVTTTLSRKPGVEVYFQGDPIVYADNADTSSPAGLSPTSTIFVVPPTKLVTIGGAPIDVTTIGTTYQLGAYTRAYIAERRRDSLLFQFVNSRGCLETVRTFGLSTEKTVAENVDHIISRFETFSDFSRNITRKHSQPSQFSISSGPVSREWAEWFAYEFCASEHHWLLLDPNHPAPIFNQRPRVTQPVWLPCTITGGDGITVIDRTKTDLLSIDMTLRVDVNGGLF